MNDFFNTLGIEATKEEKKIKKAYRARLHAVNPEDDPDGFKRLREGVGKAFFRRYLYQLRKRRGSTPEISCIFNGEFPSAITSMEKD